MNIAVTCDMALIFNVVFGNLEFTNGGHECLLWLVE